MDRFCYFIFADLSLPLDGWRGSRLKKNVDSQPIGSLYFVSIGHLKFDGAA
jgi:hypothetical protein